METVLGIGRGVTRNVMDQKEAGDFCVLSVNMIAVIVAIVSGDGQ
jgi:hypothetical protein